MTISNVDDQAFINHLDASGQLVEPRERIASFKNLFGKTGYSRSKGDSKNKMSPRVWLKSRRSFVKSCYRARHFITGKCLMSK